MQFPTEVWKVAVHFGVNEYAHCLCPEHAAKTFRDELEDARDNKFSQDGQMLILKGWTDTADRAPTEIRVTAEAITACQIARMYGPAS